ncbi:MAG TPA: fatty acid desaturase, partial [Levilinea sp.]|nr:fatty acid desaturase [Levilinea sp.]
MNTISIEERLPSMREMNRLLATYQKSDDRRSTWQLVTSLVPYAVLWVLMYFSLSVSYGLTLALSLLAAGFLVRIFILFHDCGHNSFFSSTRLNKIAGFWLGVLVFTPSEQWWKAHAIHHATSGNLDRRGSGDVNTWTLEEFVESGWEKQLGYRFFRNPLVMFVLGPIFMFVLMHRLPLPVYGKKETQSVIFANLAIIGLAAAISLLTGFQAYLLIQLPVIWIAGFFGIWLFYVQHQFENNYWERNEKWNYIASALLGASFYRLPKVLDWFSGSIGYHHIHHLSPRIPNYNLAPAHENTPEISEFVRVIPFSKGIRSIHLKVWNEGEHKMDGFPKGERTLSVCEGADQATGL